MIARDRVREALRRACHDDALALDQGLGTEYYAHIEASHLLAAIEALSLLENWHHLSAITVIVEGQTCEVLYHLWLGGGVTLRARVPVEGATLHTLSHLFPVAAWYEREIHDLTGVNFIGNTNMAPLLLPEEWTGGPPMLQDAPAEEL